LFDPTSLSDRQTAGQRLMVGFNGTGFDKDLAYLIDTLQVGGIILFSRNIESPEQIRTLCQQVQAHAAACGQPPLFIAIDQEGGQVARLRHPFTEFPGNPAMTGIRDAIDFATTTASELTGIGVNMNMAPVLDIAPEGIVSIMAARAFGQDPAWVARMGATVIDFLQRGHVLAVAKHFPGIGRTTVDSHVDLPILDAVNQSDLQRFDLIPFAAAIAHGVAGIMLSHIQYPKIDPRWPASLSPVIANRLLRTKMGYDNLVITDDLDMGAVAKHHDIDTAIAQIVAADIDIALICHRSPKMEQAVDALCRFPDADHRRPVSRILKAKNRL
jgi:beta-N-acetylhexosaminidase